MFVVGKALETSLIWTQWEAEIHAVFVYIMNFVHQKEESNICQAFLREKS